MTRISEALEGEVRGELQRHGIVVWLDRDSSYDTFVDSLIARRAAGQFPHPVVAFRGSFLDTMLTLEPFGSGLDSTPLLIHLPGFNEETVRVTPMLELYRAGARFRKSFETLVRETARGLVAPADIDAFLASPDLTVERADAWLAEKQSSVREGFDGTLRARGITGVLEDLVTTDPRFFAQEFTDAKLDVLKAFLHRETGIDDGWYTFYDSRRKLGATDVGNAFIAYLMCVEYVDDLARDPIRGSLRPLKKLSMAFLKICKELVQHIRVRYPDRYVQHADDVEAHLQDELPAIRPEDLGRIDTFRIEETRVLEAAIGALRAGEWSKATEWAAARAGENSLWLQRDQSRRWAWTLVGEAAALGQTIVENLRPLAGKTTLEDAVAEYARSGWKVDRAHRRFEQEQDALLKPRIPHFGELQEVLRSLRKLYRDWADTASRDFAMLCRTKGFLPESSLQQRNIYDEVVHPLATGSQQVAYFMIDAFRFEMAVELLESLEGANTLPDLKARLAELPTLTSVGMNALAPVVRNGKLMLAGSGRLEGFRTGEFAVSRPEHRDKAMAARTSKPLSLKLAEVCSLTAPELTRQIKGVKLIVVHSREIDDAGEANAGPQFFDRVLQNLRAAVHHLQSVGVQQFVFTADHGFLLQDETTKRITFGTRRDPSRRHVLDEHPRSEAGMVNVSFEALGYEGASGHLLFREDTAVFDTAGQDGAFFVHGGNSLQERVIPVLTIRRKVREGVSLTKYTVEAEAAGDVLGLRRVRVRVKIAQQATGTLGFVGEPKVDVGIRVAGRDDIRVTVRDAANPGTFKNGRLTVPVGDEWTEVYFALEGLRDERVRVEVYHPELIEKVEPCSPEGLFAVDGVLAVGTAVAAAAPIERVLNWQDEIADDGARKVFVHISNHNAVTEEEVHRLVGSPRAARKFALEFERHAARVPFIVRIETTSSGKRYVKDSEK